jgi:hypothetical protein
MRKLNRFTRRKREENGSPGIQDEQSVNRTSSKAHLLVQIEEANQKVRHAGDEASNASQSAQSQSQGKMQGATKNKRWNKLFSKNGKAEYASEIVPATTSPQNILDRTRNANRHSVQAPWTIVGATVARFKKKLETPNNHREAQPNDFESAYYALSRQVDLQPHLSPQKAPPSIKRKPYTFISHPTLTSSSPQQPNISQRRLSRLESLPMELLEMILLNISPKWLYPMLRTCHSIRSALLSELAYLWYPHPITGHTRRRPDEGYRFHHANCFITITFGMKSTTTMHAFLKYSTWNLNPFAPLSQSSLIVSGRGDAKAGPAKHTFSYPPIAYAEIRLDALHELFTRYPLYVHAADSRFGITYKDIHTALRKHAYTLFTQCPEAFAETTHYTFQGFEWVEETTFTIKNGWKYGVSYIPGHQPKNVPKTWPPSGTRICGNSGLDANTYIMSGHSYAGVVHRGAM